MNILHVISYLGRSQGGPVESLRLISSGESKLGHRVRIAHTGKGSDGEQACFPSSIEVVQSASFGHFRWAPRMEAIACRGGYRADVVHSHGLWWDSSRQAARLSFRLRAPLVVSPCGMLQEGALRVSSWKKRLAWSIFQKRVLQGAAILHAKSKNEAEGIRSILPDARIRIIPNPIEVPSQESRATPPWGSLSGEADLNNKKVLLYLGRLNPVKGLERLVRAWLNISEKFLDWKLVLVGPDENGFRAKLEGMIPREEKKSVVFAGPLYNEERWSAYRASDLFVLPSDFENFGQSAAEALTIGLPVITTTGTPWKEAQEKRCGWWVEPTEEKLALALQEAMCLTDLQRKTMGETGRQLAKRFDPRSIAGELCDLYQEVISDFNS